MTEYHNSIVRLYDDGFEGAGRRCRVGAFVVGYVVSGLKRICVNGICTASFIEGEMFCLGPGEHEMEHRRTAGRPYEEIMFMYGIDELRHAVSHLCVIRRFDTGEFSSEGTEPHVNCCGERAPAMIRSFFEAAVRCFDSGEGISEEEMMFRKDELVMMIMAYSPAETCRFMLRHTDNASAMFEQIVYDSIFSRRQLKTIAEMCDRSLSAFKNEFKRRFGKTPHRWFVEQRLNRALLLLKSSSMAISEISVQCMFPNTSYFIKLFHRQYGITPSAYRRKVCTCAGTSAPSEGGAAGGRKGLFFK